MWSNKINYKAFNLRHALLLLLKQLVANNIETHRFFVPQFYFFIDYCIKVNAALAYPASRDLSCPFG